MNMQTFFIQTYNQRCAPVRNGLSFKSGTEKIAKDTKFSNLYGTGNLGKTLLNGEYVDIIHSSDIFFTLRDGERFLGYITLSPRMYDGKTCYSCGELRNNSDKKGVGVKLLQVGLKAHKDSGKTGEFRVHDVLLEAEDFYEKLGFVEDLKRDEQWYLPFENEHILTEYNGGL